MVQKWRGTLRETTLGTHLVLFWAVERRFFDFVSILGGFSVDSGSIFNRFLVKMGNRKGDKEEGEKGRKGESDTTRQQPITGKPTKPTRQQDSKTARQQERTARQLKQETRQQNSNTATKQQHSKQPSIQSFRPGGMREAIKSAAPER